jgi:hypothetical protein
MKEAVRRIDLTCRSVGDEAVVLDQRYNRVHHLNESATYIWALCDGEHSLETIVREFSDRYKAPPDLAEADVQRILSEMLALQLLET